MKIGILNVATKDSGGIYQYSISLIENLLKIKGHEYMLLCGEGCDVSDMPLDYKNINACFGNRNTSCLASKLKKLIYLTVPPLREFLKKHFMSNPFHNTELELVIIPVPMYHELCIDNNYIVTIHDLQHKYYPEFFSLKERMRRDLIYKHSAQNAALVVCESEFVKRDLIYFYDIDESRIRVIQSPPMQDFLYPHINAGVLDQIKNKYNLPDKYIFYPAQFWHHKNHIRLISALGYIKSKYGIRIPLILSGSKYNSFEETFNAVRRLKLEDQVRWIGYIPRKDMLGVFKLSRALVMPTLFESVSLPVWEAFSLGVPVAVSRVCALPEQAGDAALLFDPLDIKDMGEKIQILWSDDSIAQNLVQKGYGRLETVSPKRYITKWEDAINTAVKSANMN